MRKHPWILSCVLWLLLAGMAHAASAPSVRVWLFSMTPLDRVSVVSDGSVTCAWPGEREIAFASLHLRIVRTSRNAFAVQGLAGAPETLNELTLRPSRSMTLEAGSSRRRVSGAIRVTVAPYHGPGLGTEAEASLVIVATVPLEAYTAGVVASEAESHGGLAAAAAQAVCVRSFAAVAMLRPVHLQEGADLCDSTHCQRFDGEAPPGGLAAAGTSQTRGLLLAAGGQPVPGYYHSVCGGRTATPEAVFGRPVRGITAVVDGPAPTGGSWCRAAADYRWRATVSEDDMTRALRGYPQAAGVGSVRTLRVLRTDPGGRPRRVAIVGGKTAYLSGYQFYLALGPYVGWGKVKSPAFTVTRVAAGWRFNGRGLGHGVGLCQAGAAEQSRRGQSWRSIVKFYFPRCRIVPWRAGLQARLQK